MNDRPLSHIRVLDFGHDLAGQLVGMMLADLGAEVVRIDPPGGPRWKDPELTDLASLEEPDLKTVLAERFAVQPTSHWACRLSGTSAAVVPLGPLDATRDANRYLESEESADIRLNTFSAVRHDLHPVGRWVDLAAPNAVRPERAEITIPGPAPEYGAHTREILAEPGFGDEEADALIATGNAGELWSERYLPE